MFKVSEEVIITEVLREEHKRYIGQVAVISGIMIDVRCPYRCRVGATAWEVWADVVTPSSLLKELF
jgi:hypothetical protein